MPSVPFRITLTANASQDVALGPFNRFGGGGGQMRLRATVPTTLAGTVTATIMLGSDVIVNAGNLSVESVAGGGPTNETPAYGGRGAPGDPITISIAETAGNAGTIVTGVVDIINA